MPVERPSPASETAPADEHDRPFVMLLGPTASGKSAAALALASHFDIEIVSVDSALVYRGMDIGTAKPSPEERRRVAHHLIDIRDPSQAYSAAEFAHDAAALVHAIGRRGRLPVLVGGTMLYAKALLAGLHELPRADTAVRERLDAEAQRLGWPAMHARLTQVDPITAARLAPTDAQRVQRALEVWELSGRSLSDWTAAPLAARASIGRPLILALEPSDRSVLHRRIAQRMHAMMAAGFLDEVRGLMKRADLHLGLPSMRCVGYRQMWQWLECGGSQPIGDATDRAIAATRQLAKRQLTWLRSMPQRIVVACDDPACERNVLQHVSEHCAQSAKAPASGP